MKMRKTDTEEMKAGKRAWLRGAEGGGEGEKGGVEGRGEVVERQRGCRQRGSRKAGEGGVQGREERGLGGLRRKGGGGG